MDTTTSLTVLAAALFTTTAMDALKRLSAWVTKQSPLVKRLMVLALAGLATAAAKFLGHDLPIDPTLWSADVIQDLLAGLITAVLAFGAHNLKPEAIKEAAKAPVATTTAE
jgi:hypothetical protein